MTTRMNPRTRWRVVLDSSIGERELPTRCAISQDLQDTYPSIRYPHVNDKTIAFTDSETDQRFFWKTPPAIREWLHAFDGHQDPAPVALVLLKSKAHRVKDKSRNDGPPKRGPQPATGGKKYQPIRRRVSGEVTAAR